MASSVQLADGAAVSPPPLPSVPCPQSFPARTTQPAPPTMTDSTAAPPTSSLIFYDRSNPKKVSFADLDEQKPYRINSTYFEFQKILHERVCSILISSAKNEGVHKKQILNILFNDLTYRLDSDLSNKLELRSPKRYYEVLGEYYFIFPEKAAELEKIESTHLWDDYQFQIISGLILYQWVFTNNSKRKHYNNLIKSANKIFALDSENSTRRFQPLFDYLNKNILSSTALWSSPEIQRVLLEVFSLVAKFYFFYKDVTPESLLHFLQHTQTNLMNYKDKLELPRGHHKIHTLNMMVNEVVRHLKTSKNENTIMLYLEKCEMFKGDLEIPGSKTKINLQTVLLDYTTPGLPYYPTRKIRERAKKTIDTVFPNGKITRRATNWLFRFLSPIELLRSWWFWIYSWLSLFLVFVTSSGPFKPRKSNPKPITPNHLLTPHHPHNQNTEDEMMNRASSFQEKEKEKLS